MVPRNDPWVETNLIAYPRQRTDWIDQKRLQWCLLNQFYQWITKKMGWKKRNGPKMSLNGLHTPHLYSTRSHSLLRIQENEHSAQLLLRTTPHCHQGLFKPHLHHLCPSFHKRAGPLYILHTTLKLLKRLCILPSLLETSPPKSL